MKKILLFVLAAMFAYTMNAQVLFSDDFEGGDLSAWTTINADGDDYEWQYSSNADWAYEGSGCARSASYVNYVGALEPDNWMITASPITIPSTGFTLRWYVGAADGSDYAENYSVYLATNNTVDAFTATTPIHTETLSTDEYSERTINLDAYAGQTVYLAFRHYDCTNMYWILIDNIEISKPALNPEIYLVSLNLPANVRLGESFNVGGTVRNMYSEALTSFDVTYSINGGSNATTYTVTGLNLAANETYNFTHNVPAVLNVAGTANITVTVSNPNGVADNTDDNTLTGNVIACGVENSLPIYQDFEDGLGCWTGVSMNEENTSSPYGLYSLGDNPVYVFTSYSYTDDDYSQYLISPELDLPAAAQLSFNHAGLDEDGVETCQIMVSTTTNDIASFTELGDEITATYGEFNTATAVISQDVKYIAIKYTSDFQYYLAIDDIALTEMSNDPEIALTAITTPTVVTAGTNVNVSGTVTNNSGAELNSYDVVYSLDGTTSTTYNVTGINIAAGETHDFIHNVAIENFPAGSHTLVVTVSNPNGETDNTTDNSLSATIMGCEVETVPYSEGFDTEDFGCWQNVDNDGNGVAWQHVTEFLNDPAVAPQVTYNGTANCLASIAYGQTFENVDNWIISPAIQIPANGTYAAKWYAMNVDENYAGTYEVHIATSNDVATLAASAAVATETPGGEFTQNAALLSAYAGQTIHIGIRHHNSASDRAYLLLFDEFSIESVPTDPEIALTEISVPNQVAINTSYVVNGVVVNNSATTLTSFTVACTVNGETVTQHLTCNVPYLHSYEFAVDMPGIATANDYTVTMMVSNPNETADVATDNTQTATVPIYDASTSVPRTVLMENFTTAVCPNCPDGHDIIEGALTGNLENSVIWTSHHSGYNTDALTIPLDQTMMAFYNANTTYAPAVMLDRTYWGDESFTDNDPGPIFFPGQTSSMTAAFTAALAVPAFVTVNLSDLNYNTTTRELSVTVSGNVSGPLGTTDARLNVWLLEDGLLADGGTGVGHGPSQSGAEGTFYHNHVIRVNLSGDDWGESGIVTPTEGSSYTKTYTTTVSNNYDASKCYIVAFVSNGNHSDVNNCRVFNSGKTGYLTNDQPQPEQYTITVSSNNNAWGTATVNGSSTATVAAGTTVNVSATPATGYHFVAWSDGGAQNHTVTVNSNMNLTATFAQDGGSSQGIDDVNATNVKLYPNPTTGNLYIEVEGLQKVEVIDAVGRVVMSQNNGDVINMSTLANGIYTVRVMANGNTTVKKVVKK